MIRAIRRGLRDALAVGQVLAWVRHAARGEVVESEEHLAIVRLEARVALQLGCVVAAAVQRYQRHRGDGA